MQRAAAVCHRSGLLGAASTTVTTSSRTTVSCSSSFLYSIQLPSSVRRSAAAPAALLEGRRWQSRAPSIFTLPAPSSLSHEALAFTSCPLCKTQSIHMLEMKKHLRAAHRGHFPDAAYDRACDRRLALYEEVLGVPLPSLDEAEVRRRQIEQQATLPTITADGQYQCNWCVVRQATPFRTRDAFLMHVASRHPELDIDEVEAQVPVVQSRSSSATPAPSGATRSMPSRRLEGVAPLPTPPPPTAPRSPRIINSPVAPSSQRGISIPRHLDRSVAREAELTSPAGAEVSFAPGRFPCELCGKVMVSELDLLQHLEGRHPEIQAKHSSAAAQSSSQTLSKLMRRETSEPASALSSQIAVRCDLCQSSKVYTLPSALYAHIRFKHPGEDTAYHVERIVEMGKHTKERFICPQCNKAFATDDALQGHITSKHQKPPTNTIVTRNAATAGALGVALEKSQWWCNECEKGFKSGRALLGHRVSKHLYDLGSHNCPACKRVFTDVFSLEEHMKLMHPSLSLEDLGLSTGVLCSECDRRFLEVRDLQQHLLRHHPGKLTASRHEGKPVMRTGMVDPNAFLKRHAQKLSSFGGSNSTSNSDTSGSSPLAASPAAAAPSKPRKVSRKKG